MAVKGRSISSWIFSVFRSRDKFLLITLYKYKSLVRSHLEYCCPVWHPWKIGEIQQLENVQRAFTRKITNVSHLHYWDRLKELGLMSFQRRISTISYYYDVENHEYPMHKRSRDYIQQSLKTRYHGADPSSFQVEYSKKSGNQRPLILCYWA